VSVRTRLLTLWDRLRTSYWFVPALLVVSGALLALAATAFDHRFGDATQRLQLFAATPEGARAMLTTLAGAQINLAGLTFSITIVALTVASQQYGPRLLRNFMRDVGNQVVLGTFVATFVYCVLVQGQVRNGDETSWVPALSLAIAVALALASLGVLIYFIHHVSSSIQVSQLIAAVGTDVDAAIGTLFPEEAGSGRPDVADESEPPQLLPDRDPEHVAARELGYLQAIDLDGLMDLAREKDLLIHLDCRPGDRIVPGCPVARAWPAHADGVADAVNHALIVGAQRTSVQDLEFSIDQLVEIAVRALSPGTNDPFTAMACIDRLAASMCRLAGRRIPSPVRRDASGRPRLIARPWTFGGALDSAFDQIRQYGRSAPAVMIRLVEGLELIASRLRRDEDVAAVRRQLEMIGRGAETFAEDLDRRALRQRLDRTREALDRCGTGSRRSAAA
jgi:uncharacterized membrane protein